MKATLVRTRADLRDFCELPLRLHPRDRYVPLPESVIARHRRVAALYVVRDSRGRVVGRTSTHRDAAFDAKAGPRQLFGHTEFVDDDAVFTALTGVVSSAADGRALFGPVALLPNQTGGVITSGFDARGFVDSAWNPAYYPAMYERHGFTRRFEADTWVVEVPGASYRFDDRRLEAEHLVIRHGSRRGLRDQLPILRAMLNASFAQLGYYTEISAAQLAEQTDGLAFLLDEGLLVWLEKAGRPVAFVVAVPDISEFLMRTGGRLGLVEQVRLLATRSRYRRDAVLVIKGVVPGAQGRGYMTLLSREVHRHLEAGGYRTLRSTFVERDNEASAASYRRAGGRPLHGYTFYQRGAT
ncbi:GNAT family N-acetyltransferase [Actinoplanes solisilvae]|uniref:GNAT family N-acetyltransferase n=1 Tax=Actinoplanes solisilvae TaxID=2486853 RepID=UPI000FD7E576|nr:GNAT family N-acetyltransferase [Actinoplanes solisilvae]